MGEVGTFRLEQLWMETAKKIADCYRQHNLLEQAATWYVKICNLRPEDEQSNFLLMKLYAQLEYGLLVNHQFAQLKNALADLGIPIDPNIRQWHENWKNQKADKRLF